MVDYLKECARYMKSFGLNPSLDDEKKIISTYVQCKNGLYKNVVILIPDGKQLMSQTYCPVRIPSNQRRNLAELASRLNLTRIHTSLILDFDSGDFFCKAAINFDGISDMKLRFFMDPVMQTLQMMDHAFPMVMKILHNNLSPREAVRTEDRPGKKEFPKVHSN